jgi:hypothetical protein
VQRTQFHHTSQLPVHSFADALRVQVRRRAADGSDTSLGEVTFPRCAEFVAERGAQRGWYALQDPDVTGQSPRRLISVSSTAPPAPALAPRGAAGGRADGRRGRAVSFVPAARRAADALALGEHGGLHALPLHPEHLAPLESLTEFIDADREGEAALVTTSPIPRVYELCHRRPRAGGGAGRGGAGRARAAGGGRADGGAGCVIGDAL